VAATMDWSAQGGAGPEAYQSFLVPAMFAPFAELLLDEVELAAGARVLDVACGTGALSRAAARRVGSTGAVTGVDLSEPMLAVAREQPAEPGAAPIEYRQSSAEELAPGDARFDFAICQQGLQFFSDKLAALRAMRAALAPGGRIAIATWTDLEGSPGFAALARALAAHVSEDAGAMMRSPWGLSEPDELQRLLAEAGLERIIVSQHTLPSRFAQRVEFARRVISAGPVSPLFAAADPAAQRRVADDVGAMLRGYAVEDGVRFQMTSNVAVATAP
jgi:2-polyprenyl-3-methyl-5-hydroxy-6-metoxy-1,4-benzoquinol methylase